MNAKKLLIGGIVGGIVYFLLGWLAYGKLLMSYFNDHTGIFFSNHHDLMSEFNRPQPIFLYLGIGNLLQGFLLSYVFVKGKINSFGSGFITGGIIGFLGGSAMDSIMFSTTTAMSRTAVAADVITFTIMSAITGAIVAIASGTGDPSA